MCAGTRVFEASGGREEGLNLSPADLLEEGPHSILLCLVASTEPGRSVEMDQWSPTWAICARVVGGCSSTISTSSSFPSGS